MILFLLVGSRFAEAFENDSSVELDNFTHMRVFKTQHEEKFEKQFMHFIKKNALLLGLTLIAFSFICGSVLYYMCTKKPHKNKLIQNFDNV